LTPGAASRDRSDRVDYLTGHDAFATLVRGEEEARPRVIVRLGRRFERVQLLEALGRCMRRLLSARIPAVPFRGSFSSAGYPLAGTTPEYS
jgi:hypothetical protein